MAISGNILVGCLSRSSISGAKILACGFLIYADSRANRLSDLRLIRGSNIILFDKLVARMGWNIMLTSRQYLVNLAPSFGCKFPLLAAREPAEYREICTLCNILVLVTFSAEVDAQMVELVVHCKVQ